MKQRIVKTVIALLALWPIAHIALVHSTELNPWKGLGWGMYTVPLLKVDVRINPVRGHGEGVTPEGKEATRLAMVRYHDLYRVIGSRAMPDEVARVAFASYPHYRTIEILATQKHLDPRSARVAVYRSSKLTYRLRKDGSIHRVPTR